MANKLDPFTQLMEARLNPSLIFLSITLFRNVVVMSFDINSLQSLRYSCSTPASKSLLVGPKVGAKQNMKGQITEESELSPPVCTSKRKNANVSSHSNAVKRKMVVPCTGSGTQSIQQNRSSVLGSGAPVPLLQNMNFARPIAPM